MYLAQYKFSFKLHETTNKQLHSLTVFFYLFFALFQDSNFNP